MKKTLLLSALLLAFFGCIKAQTVTFQKSIGNGLLDDGKSVLQTNDGDYIICGNTLHIILPLPKIYVIKTNSAGDTLWTNIFYNNSGTYTIESIAQTNDNGYILVGCAYGITHFNQDSWGYFLKLDSSGNIQWNQTFDAFFLLMGHRIQRATCVHQTNDSGYIASGNIVFSDEQTDSVLVSDAFLVKTNAIGDTLWTKCYGGIKDELVNSIDQTANNGYILAGSTNSFCADSLDVFIVRTNSGGDTLWSKRYGGNDNEWANSIKQSNDGGYIIAGTTQSFGAGNKDIYLIHTDANGNVVWSKTYGGIGDEEGNSVQLTDDGGYIIAGSTKSFGAGGNDAYLIKTDSSGNLIWSKTFGDAGDDVGKDIKQTIDGGFVVTGVSGSGGGLSSVLFLKTDRQGMSICNQANPATVTTEVATPYFRVAPLVTLRSFNITKNALIDPTIHGGISNNCVQVSIDEATYNTDNISIFPNPNSGNFTINLVAEIQKGKLEIFNMQGEMIFKEQIANQSKIDINLKSISAGIYLLKLFDHEKQYSYKFIIE